MFDKLKLGTNDEELDDYRDFDDEHTERGSKLDDFGVDEDEDDAEEAPPASAPGTVEAPVPVGAGESKPEAAPAPNNAELPTRTQLDTTELGERDRTPPPRPTSVPEPA